MTDEVKNLSSAQDYVRVFIQTSLGDDSTPFNMCLGCGALLQVGNANKTLHDLFHSQLAAIQ